MKTDPEQVRLPELPIFKKYSLALREEYARAPDVLAMLERTSSRIKEMVEKAEDLRRKEDEIVSALQVEAEAEVETLDEVEHDEPPEVDEPEDEDVRPFWENDDSEVDPVPPGALSTPRARPKPKVAAKKATKAKPSPKKPAARKKASAVRTQIVRVGERGTPLTSRSAKPKPKTKPKPKPKARAKPKPKPKPSSRSRAKVKKR